MTIVTNPRKEEGTDVSMSSDAFDFMHVVGRRLGSDTGDVGQM